MLYHWFANCNMHLRKLQTESVILICKTVVYRHRPVSVIYRPDCTINYQNYLSNVSVMVGVKVIFRR